MSLALSLALNGMAQAVSLGDPLMQSSGPVGYRIVDSEVGGSGDFDSASSGPNGYRFQVGSDDGGSTLGDTAVGNSASTNYQTNAGFNTSYNPALTFCVGTSGTSCADMTGSTVDLGVLSTSVASTATAKFSVKNYTSYSYAVTVIGTPPSYGGNPLNGMGTQSPNSTGCTPACASQAGVEQFGINLRANTSPVSFGIDPDPQPSSVFSLSDPNVVIPTSYRTANQFRFYSGDTIATAPRSSGETTYTVSFLANISNVTPGGKYLGALEFVATGTY